MITSLPRIAIAARDFDAIARAFREQLGMPIADLSAYSGAALGARLAMCVPAGGSNIELMSPADPAAPLGQSLERFLTRRGDGFFALMLEAPVPDEEAVSLRERGLRVLPLMAGASGRDVHPASTHGVLIRVYPCDSFQAGNAKLTSSPGRDIGLSGIARACIAVRDAKRALDTYARGIGLTMGALAEDEARGTLSVACTAPKGATIELVEPSDPSRPSAAAIAQHLERVGEGLFALVLQAKDAARAAAKLAARGLPVRPLVDGPGTFEIDPAGLFGARLWIETASA
jgi:hypothetical protein